MAGEENSKRRGRRRGPQPLDPEVVAAEQAALERLYAHSDGAVAYVDESFRVHGPQGSTFYVMCAALLERSELRIRRAGLAEMTAGRGVHATEWFRDGRLDELAGVLTWAAEHTGWNFITVHTPVDGAAGDARRICLTALLGVLHTNKVRTVIMDTRGRDSVDAQDKAVAHEMRSKGEIDRYTTLRHADDRAEILVGCADIVAWSYRRVLANGDDRWWPLVSSVTTVVDAGTSGEILGPEQL